MNILLHCPDEARDHLLASGTRPETLLVHRDMAAKGFMLQEGRILDGCGQIHAGAVQVPVWAQRTKDAFAPARQSRNVKANFWAQLEIGFANHHVQNVSSQDI